ncbi:YifB family Mg chelatase-like AAA ATPase [Glaciecola siphonariae]|uniref:YifB family Mg chelatase-like AAA ATPase n=1 Tax=Glaciecola siphonariae TaxID=521012 RepID=A0ABV9LS58_9ALTE
MSLSVVYTRANIGIDAPLVTIEVHLSNGMPAFQLVGLPETSVKESRDRVRSALINAGFEFPSKRITVNMAPADLPKGGGRFDLAIAIGIIAASEELPDTALEPYEFVGELALSGELRSIQGALPMAFAARNSNRQLILPLSNANEAALVTKTSVLCASTLFDVYLHLTGKQALPVAQTQSENYPPPNYGDLNEIIDQQHAKRALEIAASGAHNILFFGPAGTGKSMLASRLLSIMPDLSEEDALVVSSIRSVVGEPIDANNWRQRPLRQPHHSSSAAAIVGGGTYPKPGEITLAHKGVLFLDELPEFGRHVLDVMREPLETGEINLSRAAHKVCYPADFQLVAAMNPSPTGDIDDKRANPDQILRYLNRISGPLLDRIDLQVNVPRVNLEKTLSRSVAPNDESDTGNDNRQDASEHGRGSNHEAISKQSAHSSSESSKIVKRRVETAHALQLARQGVLNSALSNQQINIHCSLTPSNQRFITQAIDALGLSMRAYHRTLKVARTVADLQGAEHIEQAHIAEALSFRNFDRLLHQLTNS